MEALPPPISPNERLIPESHEAFLTAEELAEYLSLKIAIRETLLTEGVWSDDFNTWIDQHLMPLGWIGKTLETRGALEAQRKTAERQKLIEHYKQVSQHGFDKYGGLTPEVQRWLAAGSPQSFERVGGALSNLSDVGLAVWLGEQQKKRQSAPAEKEPLP